MKEWRHERIADLLYDVCDRFKDKEALVFTESRTSYETLLKRTKAVAKGLIAIGIEKGEKVGVLCPNRIEWPLLYLGCAMIGAICVPVNMLYRLEEIEYTLKHMDVKAFVLIDQFANADFLAMLHELVPEIKGAEPGKIQSEKFPCLKAVITLTDPPGEGMWSFRQLETKLGKSVKNRDKLQERFSQVTGEDVIVIQPTSGTTSFPKGVMLKQEGQIANSYWHLRRLGVTSEDRIFSFMPFYHMGGTMTSLMGTLNHGATLFMTPRLDIEETMKIIDREKCTTVFGLETPFFMMMSHPDYKKYDLSSLKKGFSTGTPEALRKIIQEMGITYLSNAYGLSEAGANCAINELDDPIERRCQYCGRSHPYMERKIVDHNRETLAPGVPGELAIRSISTMKGYYKQPEETKKVLDEDGWLYTSDRALIDEDGYLQFLGRLKDMYRVGGENVAAAEVEAFLMGHPKVSQVAAISVPDERLTEVGMVFVQLKAGESGTESELINYCKKRIAPFKVPRYVRFVNEFPTTGSGKIQKHVLKKQVLEKEFQRAG